MHIPDGFIDGTTALATGAVALGAVTVAVRRESAKLGERAVPLLGVSAAFVFAAQMVNFPVAGGTSGHLLGAMLVAALLGPWAAVVVLTVVLVVQALGMADGGVTALGANVCNMAVVGGLGAYLLFGAIRRLLPRSPSTYFLALAVASWTSAVLAAAAASAELAFSGTVPLRISLPAMTSIHMVIGIGEALITVTVVGAVLAARPDLVKTWDLPPSGRRRPVAGRGRHRLGFVTGGLVVALAVAVFVSPFASSTPDGLERVAKDKGFGHDAAQPLWRFSPLEDYALPDLPRGAVSTAVAGCMGALLLFGSALGAGMLISRGRRGPTPVLTGHVGTGHALGGHEHADHRHAGHLHVHRHEGPAPPAPEHAGAGAAYPDHSHPHS